METNYTPYDICRLYVEDLPGTFPARIKRRLEGYLRAKSLAKLVECSSLTSSASNCTAEVIRALMQVEAFFKKNAELADEGKCLAAAQEAFIANEQICKETNSRLDKYYLERDQLDPDLQKMLNRMEYWISDTLGSFNTFLGKLPEYVAVTSGATTNTSRRKSLPYLKIRKRMDATSGAEKYLQCLSQYFGYGSLRINQQNSNRVEFVPKNWKTFRTIACEPTGNTPLQLAFDRYGKERLRLQGFNLSDQSRNQRLARQGSIDNSIATIDLKAASDTVAFNSVAWLFPEPWFQYLNDLRCRCYHGTVNGAYEKFSSMGNGSTFVIETLIFAAATIAIGSKTRCVYGDDVIIDSDKVDDFMKLMSFLGFTINTDKSYVDGPFRESCGSNWYEGVDITPFYLRECGSRKTVTAHNVNGLAMIAVPDGKLWGYLRDLTESENLQRVPFNQVSTSGVWIDVGSAYSQGLIKNVHSRKDTSRYPRYRAYVNRQRTTLVCDTRTLFLWSLQKLQKKVYLEEGPPKMFDLTHHGLVEKVVSPDECSRVPAFGHKFVRKWVGWVKPPSMTPVHLYRWTEYLDRS